MSFTQGIGSRAEDEARPRGMAAVRERVYRRYPGAIDEQHLSPQEIAALMGIDRERVVAAIRSGELPAAVDRSEGGERYRIRLADAKAKWGAR